MIADTPGVESVFRHYVAEVPYQRRECRAQRVLVAVLAERKGLDLLERIGRTAKWCALCRAAGVIVYDAFQRHFGVQPRRLDRARHAKGTTRLHGRWCSSDVWRRWRHPDGHRHVRSVLAPTGCIESDRLDRTESSRTYSMRYREESEGSNRSSSFQASRRIDSRGTHSNDHTGPIYALLGLVAVLAGGAVANLLVGAAKDLSRGHGAPAVPGRVARSAPQARRSSRDWQ